MSIDSNIREFIKDHGHIKIDTMMKILLSADNNSYYRSIRNIGSDGDFITAPEISQLFGEAVALWVIEQWEKLGEPKDFVLMELGAGLGTLMHDVLNVTKLVPNFLSSVTIYFVEINKHFIQSQKTKIALLRNYLSNDKFVWLDNVYEINSNKPMIVIANEFFDSLPIKQYIKSKELWYERICIIDPNDEMIKYDKMQLHQTLQKQFLVDHPDAKDGAVLEESNESLELVGFISSHIKKYTGSLLIIDYGYFIPAVIRSRNQYNCTLQAIKQHRYCPILSNLGEADITSHVDFAALVMAASHHEINNSIIRTQREFLIEYGILIRLETLRKKLPDNEYQTIYRQVSRLIDDDKMGHLFKVLTCHNFGDM